MKPSTVVLLMAGAGVLASCEDPKVPPPPANPPQAFLTITESNVMGDSVKGRVNVSGCKGVTQVAIFQQDSFLFDTSYSKSPTEFTLPAGLFSNLYPRLGFSASLTLKAKVTCDDGRTNFSTPVGVKFFPVARKYSGRNGEQLVPDAFVAEGGVGGSANTFLGCVRTQTGTTIARVDTSGQLLAFIGQMPFDCSLNTQILDLSTTSGYRWIFEPFVGAFALCLSASCTDFSVGKVIRSPRAERIGVGKSGVAVVWINELGTQQNRIVKLSPGANDVSNDWSSSAGFPIILNANPHIDDGAGQSVWISRWEYNVGTKVANIVPYKHDLRTGALTNGVVNGVPAVLLTQQYPLDSTSMPIIPEGFFSTTGDVFTIPILSYAQDNTLQTTVISCSTAFGLCEGQARRWTSPTFPGMVRLALPFSAGNLVAAIGPYQVWFLTQQLGTVVNLGERAITPSGSLMVLGVQPGNSTDFYILNGPDLQGSPSFPTEIIALDSPQAGELWRVGYGSGEGPLNAMTIAIDSADRPWLRAGTELVQPLTNGEYRSSRGPTMLP